MEELHFETITPEAKKQLEDEFLPRPEYEAGEIPFEYKYIFSSGEIFKAFQDQEGVGQVIIQRDGETIFDFSKLLPQDFVFVTPKYFQKFPEKQEFLDPIGYWGTHADRKLILLGDLRSPKTILTLLHEIGHSNNSDDEKERLELLRGPHDDLVIPRSISFEKRLAHIESKTERRAWAWALVTVRKMQKDTGIAFSELFPTFLDLKKYIYTCLATHRRSHEWVIRDGHDKEFYKEMQKLFDRWHYDFAKPSE